MPEVQNPVVASLKERSATGTHPYSSIAMSPNRKLAIVAGKDTLQLIRVGPAGISELRSMRISQHFQTPAMTTTTQDGMRNIDEERNVRGSFVRDTFGLVSKQSPTGPRGPTMTNINVTITDVAWSLPEHRREDASSVLPGQDSSRAAQETADAMHASKANAHTHNDDDDSVIAAAGSNGVVVVWSAKRAFFHERDESSSSSINMTDQQPEAILSQHSRAVNRLAWHPRRPGLLLTASQDSTVKLWVRRASTSQALTSNAHQHAQSQGGLRSWFRMNVTPSTDRKSYSWQCRATFEPKSEAVRDVRWSPFRYDIFAIVTVSGSLILYNMYVQGRAIIKISAHAGDATTLDWHPTRPYIVATGGSNDRCVKVWDLESTFTVEQEEANMISTSNTVNSRTDSLATESSSETERSGYASSTIGSGQQIAVRTLNASSRKASSVRMLHMLTVSATVTRLRWRPPAAKLFNPTGGGLDDEDSVQLVDRHDSMLAVATAPVKGASAGGSGVLSLWSYHRPYMPLSVLEGHQDGAVNDFFWIDTPQPAPQNEYEYLRNEAAIQHSGGMPQGSNSASAMMDATRGVSRSRRGGVDDHQDQTPSSIRSPRHAHGFSNPEFGSMLYESAADIPDQEDQDHPTNSMSAVCIWQHVLSVGRDGRCLLQSFARGDRPISRVPPSCFSMANYSPFQRGYGSLQIFSVHQKLPTAGPNSEFYFAGIRQDAVTARAPGVFRELPPVPDESSALAGVDNPIPLSSATSGGAKNAWAAGKRIPEFVPELIFNVVDEGELDSDGKPIDCAQQEAIMIAPEVVHLSRFAKSYKFYPDDECPTRVDICLHNGKVAERLRRGSLARMWVSVASMLHGSGLDELMPQKGSIPDNIMQFVLLPTLKALLYELADAGDVQSCVALCEVLQVIHPDQTTKIPGLKIQIVREWYLSYIDLLRDMCLFSKSASLIRSCKDPFIGALNQQSTSVHESCPRCGKPLLPSSESLDGNASNPDGVIVRRMCKTCRSRVGLCFLCHEPVKGMFVWCPGCGHGGHLNHALQWFGGLSGQPIREMCPTGCGHKCNLLQPLNAFPRTDSIAFLDGLDTP